MTPLLQVRGLTRRYGSLCAVEDVDLDVPAGGRHAVIGPNGAGKSTLFGLLAGAIRPTGGTVALEGRDVSGLRAHERARAGLVKTFQHSSLFDSATCLENVALAVRTRRGLGARAWRPARRLRDVDAEAADHLAQVGLGDRGRERASALAHGERRQLDVAIALAARPRLLMLDEPTAGMARSESERFVALVQGLPRSVTVMIVEHDLDVVFGLAERIAVMTAGRILAQGAPDEIRASAAVQDAYLGAGSSASVFVS